jgi:hypothetical protein
VFVSPALNELLAAEVAAGNAVAEDGPGFGGAARLVILAGRFRTTWPGSGLGLAYRDIRDTPTRR